MRCVDVYANKTILPTQCMTILVGSSDILMETVSHVGANAFWLNDGDLDILFSKVVWKCQGTVNLKV